MRTLRGIGFTLEQTANKHNDVQSVRRCCIYIISSLGSGMVIKSYDKSVIRSSGNECDESTSVKINSLSPSLPLICHATQLNEFSFSTDNIHQSSHIVSQKTTCQRLSLFTVWPAVPRVFSCYRIYDVYEPEEIDNLVEKEIVVIEAMLWGKSFSVICWLFFLLFPYCFYNKKQSECWKEQPNVLLKDKSSMSRGTAGLKVEVIAMFMYCEVFLTQLTLC